MTRALILGGSRSGKSAYAESLANGLGKEVVYIATARAGDSEMAARIGHHRQQRPAAWMTVEEPIALGDALQRWRAPQRVVIVDCLTLWLSNLLFSGNAAFPDIGTIELPTLLQEQRANSLAALENPAGDVVLVSNEVGMGIVPQGAVSRCFTDQSGRLNQAVASVCERVVLVAAGLPLVFKDAPCSPS